MTMRAWLGAGWVRAHETRAEEVHHLWEVAASDLRSAADPAHAVAVRFEYAYNAALKFCIVALYAESLRPGQVKDVHHTIIRSLPLTLGAGREVAADYLDACRERRDRLGDEDAQQALHEDDVAALLGFARELGDGVRAWLAERHPRFAITPDLAGP